MKKLRALVSILILSMLFSIAPLSFFAQSKPVNPTVDPTFSIMQITDTQHLAFLNPTLYNDLTSWIVTNAASYNLKMVVHTGDFIDAFVPNPAPPPPFIGFTPAQKAVEWSVANTAMSQLLIAGIPYCWCAGNHDTQTPNTPSATMPGSSYPAFDATAMRQKSYWVSDNFDSKNTAVKFAVNGYDFMIIDIEYMATVSVLDWMESLINQNPSANIIIATHVYLNVDGGYGSTTPGSPEPAWALSLKAKLDSYPNVFLTLSAHLRGASTIRVDNRQEIFFDRQEENNLLGAASVRIYTFNLETNQVSTSTYCRDTDSWLTDAKNQFSFSVNLIKDMYAGEGRVDVNNVRYQGDTTVFLKSTTIDVIVDNRLCTWTITQHDILNNIEAYDGNSELGRIKLNINNGCVVANGPEVHFQSNE